MPALLVAKRGPEDTVSGRRRLSTALVMAVALSLPACSSAGDRSGGSAGSEPADGDPFDAGGLLREGEVDEVVAMIPPGQAMRPPDTVLVGGGTLVSARHLLRAPDGQGHILDLWILQVRNPELGPDVQRCQVVEIRDLAANGYCGVLTAPPPDGRTFLVQGGSGDDVSTTAHLAGPPGTTHFIVTVGDRRIAVIPIGVDALVNLPCPSTYTVVAWQDDEVLQEDPAYSCGAAPGAGAGG